MAGCPILAVFARVGIFGPFTLTSPIIPESKPPPFENHKGWGTRTERPNQFLGVDILERYDPVVRVHQRKNAEGWTTPPTPREV